MRKDVPNASASVRVIRLRIVVGVVWLVVGLVLLSNYTWSHYPPHIYRHWPPPTWHGEPPRSSPGETSSSAAPTWGVRASHPPSGAQSGR
jgi:hypothetical protein